MLTLEAKKRGATPKPHVLRKQGQIPAVFYGRKEKSTPISISYKDFEKVWKKAGESTVITLKGEWGDKETLIVGTDCDPLTGAFRHADFYVVEKGQKVKVKVPVEFTGTAPAVKELGGVLLKVLHEIEVEAEPSRLPHTIAADISKLFDFKSQLLAKDILLPAGVELVTNQNEVVAAMDEAKEEEEKPVEAVDFSNIEISEKRGKEEGATTEGAQAGAELPAKGDKQDKAEKAKGKGK